MKQLKRGVASRYNRSPIVVALALLGACTGGAAVHAETTSEAKPAAGVLFSLDYTLDLQGVARGGLERGTRHLDVLTLSADVDLDSSLGWRGGAAHFDVQNTSGEAPGELTGSLQGVNGAEVSARRLRLYQAWLEQGFAEGRANLRLGFSDLSGNFGVADASGLLLNPSFGMAPDFAASGAAAFPSTALAARLRLNPGETTYVQVAAANARQGVPGDGDGADLSFDDGEVLVAEAGWTGRGKVAVGYWRLTQRQADLFEVDGAGDPVRRRMEGAYLVVEQPVTEKTETTRGVSAFLRLGASDGDTSEISGSWQAGLLVEPAFAGRPESAFSAAVTQARLSSAYRNASAAQGLDLARDETVFELAYSDMLTPHLRIQPDLQYVRRPGGDRSVKDALVVGVRFNLAY